jgi:hypothetical protein
MSNTKEWALNILKEINVAWDFSEFEDYNGDPSGIILTDTQISRLAVLFENIEEYIRLKEDLPDKNMN